MKALEGGISGSFSTFPTGFNMTSSASFSSLAKAFLNQRKVGNGKLSYLMYWYHCWCETYHLTGIEREGREDIHILRPNALRFRERFTISGRDTKAIDDVVVEWKYVGWYNYSSGKQREVKRYLPAAIQFFEEVRASGFEVPEDIRRKFYHSTVDCETYHLAGMVVGGRRSFYHSTSSSPFRLYHPLQQTKKEVQPQVFKGCTNIDITSCFLSLYWHDMGGEVLSGPDYYYLLNPLLKDDLHKKIAESFGEGDAKSLRNNLTQTNKNGHITMTGVQWYDDLHHFVVGHARQWGREVLGWDYDECTPHKLFTFLELRLINRLIGCGTPVLRMHDGIIFKDVDIQSLKERAAPHLVKVERW
jgi:hypothetical protein